jgi:hypothetical protein
VVRIGQDEVSKGEQLVPWVTCTVAEAHTNVNGSVTTSLLLSQRNLQCHVWHKLTYTSMPMFLFDLYLAECIREAIDSVTEQRISRHCKEIPLRWSSTNHGEYRLCSRILSILMRLQKPRTVDLGQVACDIILGRQKAR